LDKIFFGQNILVTIYWYDGEMPKDGMPSNRTPNFRTPNDRTPNACLEFCYFNNIRHSIVRHSGIRSFGIWAFGRSAFCRSTKIFFGQNIFRKIFWPGIDSMKQFRLLFLVAFLICINGRYFVGQNSKNGFEIVAKNIFAETVSSN
jgi:hypothetical protein